MECRVSSEQLPHSLSWHRGQSELPPFAFQLSGTKMDLVPLDEVGSEWNGVASFLLTKSRGSGAVQSSSFCQLWRPSVGPMLVQFLLLVPPALYIITYICGIRLESDSRRIINFLRWNALEMKASAKRHFDLDKRSCEVFHVFGFLIWNESGNAIYFFAVGPFSHTYTGPDFFKNCIEILYHSF